MHRTGGGAGLRCKIRKPLLMSTGPIWQGRVYCRPRGRDAVVFKETRWGRFQREEPMGSERTSRRQLLKSSAALAGLSLGVPLHAQANEQAAASGSENAYPMLPYNKEMIAYGERSHFVTSVRIPHPFGSKKSPDEFGKVFHVASPIQDQVGNITQSSLPYIPTTPPPSRPHPPPRPPPVLPSGHRSQETHSDDPRPGGSAPDLHYGRLEALPVSQPVALPRVRGKPAH